MPSRIYFGIEERQLVKAIYILRRTQKIAYKNYLERDVKLRAMEHKLNDMVLTRQMKVK